MECFSSSKKLRNLSTSLGLGLTSHSSCSDIRVSIFFPKLSEVWVVLNSFCLDMLRFLCDSLSSRLASDDLLVDEPPTVSSRERDEKGEIDTVVVLLLKLVQLLWAEGGRERIRLGAESLRNWALTICSISLTIDGLIY